MVLKIIVLGIYQTPEVNIYDSISFNLIIYYSYHRPRPTLLWFSFIHFSDNLIYLRSTTPVSLFFLQQSKWDDSQTPKLHQNLYSSPINRKNEKKIFYFHVSLLDQKCLNRKNFDYVLRW